MSSKACLQQQVATQEPGENIKPASKQQVINWVVQSNKDMIRKYFLVCGMSNALDGSEDHMIRCAKELPDMIIAYGTEDTEDNPIDGGTESEDPFATNGDGDNDSDHEA